MAARDTIPFSITITPAGEGYAVLARGSMGEATAELVLPGAIEALGARLLRPGVFDAAADAAAIGRVLGRALLSQPVRELLLACARAAAQERARLQVRLQIAAPELAALPWEWMTLGADDRWQPALRDEYTIVRGGRRVGLATPLRLDGSLRVLVVAGRGQEAQLEALEDACAPLIRAGKLDLRLLERASLESIRRELAEDAPHIVQIAAAAAVSDADTLEVAIGRGTDAFDIAELLDSYRETRMVLISGASGAGDALAAGPGLLSALLLSAQRPAVVALGGPLPAVASAAFAAAVYGQLVRGAAVDVAVTAGRRALATRQDAWGLAQVRVAPDGEQIFTLVPGKPSLARGRIARPTIDLRPSGTWRTPRVLLPAAGVAVLALAILLGARAFASRGGAVGGAAGELVLPLVTLAPLATSMPVPTMLPAPVGYVVHTAATSDTAVLVAGQLGSAPAAIAALNGIDLETPIRTGRQIIVPVYQAGVTGSTPAVVGRAGDANVVAMTFDIEIDEATLIEILRILRERQVKGTFFVTGNWVEAYPDAARAIVADGHEVANHSMTHPFFSRIGRDSAAQELDATEAIVQQTLGVTTRPHFRFPYGDSTAEMVDLAAQRGYLAYHWDTDEAGAAAWLAGVETDPAFANGAIILMHGRQETVALLSGFLDTLLTLGIKPTTLTEALR